MRFVSTVQSAFLLVVALLAGNCAARADTFTVQFLENSTQVGTGTFSYTGHVGDGIYNLNTLPNYSFDLSVGSWSWSTANLLSVPGMQAEIRNNSGQVSFSNADFFNGAAALVVFSLDLGPKNLDLFAAFGSRGDNYSGNFVTSATPEPSSIAMLVVGTGILSAVWFIARRRKQVTGSSIG